MAKWVVFENSRGNLSLNYENVITGQVHPCGELRQDTPRAMIVDWVVKQGDASPGDFIRFDDGATLFFYFQHALA